MDPVTAAVVAAVAAGAAAGGKDTAAQAVKDAYAGLKSVLSRKYGNVDVSEVEHAPDSEANQASLAENLEQAGAAGDSDLRSAAAALLKAMEQPAGKSAAAVDINGLKAGSLIVGGVVASENEAVHLRDIEADGIVRIEGVWAGVRDPQDPPTARA